MRVSLQDDILTIYQEDLPNYKKGGSIVRNSFFWALKSISCYAARGGDWEFDADVWVALSRMLLALRESGYLKYSETILEFTPMLPFPKYYVQLLPGYEHPSSRYS